MSAQGKQKRGPGRPKTYSSDAERVKAWRQRQKELIAAATQPIVIEKVVERIIQVPAAKKISTQSDKTPDARALRPFLRKRIVEYGYYKEENARRFRTNAAKAATCAKEILKDEEWCGVNLPEVEKIFLKQVVQFFDNLNEVLHGIQISAKQVVDKREKEREAEHEARLKEIIALTFGKTLDLDIVSRTAAALLEFSDAKAFLESKSKVQENYVTHSRDGDLRNALKEKNAKKIAREIAEIRLLIGEKGRYSANENSLTRWYKAGWDDFESFVRTK